MSVNLTENTRQVLVHKPQGSLPDFEKYLACRQIRKLQLTLRG